MALEGTLNYLEIADLLRVIGRSQKSGVMEIVCGDRQARLYFERGALVCAQSNRFHDGVGTLLLRAGLLSEAALENALNIQKTDGGGRRLGAILVDEFGLRPEDIEEVLRHQFERIAFDVFSWPGGTFVFRFTKPSDVTERFRLDPADFILGVGIQGGLLAQEGVSREKQNLSPQDRSFPRAQGDP